MEPHDLAVLREKAEAAELAALEAEAALAAKQADVDALGSRPTAELAAVKVRAYVKRYLASVAFGRYIDAVGAPLDPINRQAEQEMACVHAMSTKALLEASE